MVNYLISIEGNGGRYEGHLLNYTILRSIYFSIVKSLMSSRVLFMLYHTTLKQIIYKTNTIDAMISGLELHYSEQKFNCSQIIHSKMNLTGTSLNK